VSGVWAVLVAAGRGARLGDERPKAFAKLGQLPLLAESLQEFVLAERFMTAQEFEQRVFDFFFG